MAKANVRSATKGVGNVYRTGSPPHRLDASARDWERVAPCGGLWRGRRRSVATSTPQRAYADAACQASRGNQYPIDRGCVAPEW